jgi:hypothetical protein
MREKIRLPWWSVPLAVVLLPVIAVVVVLWAFVAVLLHIVVWVAWCPRGRYALLVYSNSPVWRDYFEEQVLPAVGTRAVVLNWSERKRWNLSLAVVLFRVFGGFRQFNPLAMVFEPLAWLRRFRFYNAFRSFKHGRPAEVERLRDELLAVLDAVAPVKAT